MEELNTQGTADATDVVCYEARLSAAVPNRKQAQFARVGRLLVVIPGRKLGAFSGD